MRKEPMKKKPAKQDDLLPEYDFENMKGSVRGKYASKLAGTVHAVPIEADVAKAFPSAKDVNDALRMLIAIAKKTSPHTRSR